MSKQCLICDSPAILSRQAAVGIFLLIGLTNSALKSAQNTNETRRGLIWLLGAAAGIAPAYPEALRNAERVTKAHLSRFGHVCLECGALFGSAEEKPPS